MVDARVSGARAERRAGSSPVLGTDKARQLIENSIVISLSFIFTCILRANSLMGGIFTLHYIQIRQS